MWEEGKKEQEVCWRKLCCGKTCKRESPLAKGDWKQQFFFEFNKVADVSAYEVSVCLYVLGVLTCPTHTGLFV